jgi:peptidoglycan hydrolase CwlO-like protein
MTPNKESLSFMDQLQRYWTILASIIAIGVGMQVQINSNSNYIESLLEFKRNSEPLYLRSLEMQAEIKGDLKSVQLDIKNTKDNQERVLKEVEKFNEELRQLYKDGH